MIRGAILGMGVGTLLGGSTLFVALPSLRWAQPEDVSTYAKGRRVAERLGCFTCHGPDGKSGTTNFVPDLDEVPSWARGNFKSFVQTPEEVSEWILDGTPARMRNNPDEMTRIDKLLIKMPGYRDQVRKDELDALVHYVLACSTFLPQEENTPIAKGREVATRMGCFGCHGGEGRARPANLRSFKGYIPSWDSSDYLELVESPGEFREWVLYGAAKRLRNNPAAKFFIERQQIQMPAYEKRITEEEVDHLHAYVTYLRSRG